jgi:hypothetical protein
MKRAMEVPVLKPGTADNDLNPARIEPWNRWFASLLAHLARSGSTIDELMPVHLLDWGILGGFNEKQLEEAWRRAKLNGVVNLGGG